MMLFLDSAMTADAGAAQTMGWVSGMTTNPQLMAATGRPPEQQLEDLLNAFGAGPILVQPTTPEGADSQIRRALEIGQGRVIAKLPAQEAMLALGARLVSEGHQVAITAVYSPAQTVVAAASGASWIIPYFDRARRLRPDQPLVPEMRAVLDALGSPARILAASIKTPGQAVIALRAGANAISAPLPVLLAMTDDPLTDEAVRAFAEAGD